MKTESDRRLGLPKEKKETLGQAKRPFLAEVLPDAAHRNDLVLSSNVSEIRIDPHVLAEINTIMQDTYDDPNHMEKCAGIYVLPKGKVTTDRTGEVLVNPNGEIVKLMVAAITENGTKDSSLMTSYMPTVRQVVPNSSDKKIRQDKIFIGVTHTHGLYDVPQSPPDLYPLFLDPELPESAMLSSVRTPERNIFVFRGENTPIWDRKQAAEQIGNWTTKYNNGLNKIFSLMTGKASEAEDVRINRYVTTILLNELSKAYDLRIFSGNANTDTIIEGPLEKGTL